MSSIQEDLITARVIAILRGDYTETLESVVTALLAGGVRAIEVTMNSADALGLIKRLTDLESDQLIIGAGTVLTVEQVEQVRAARARFVVSPDTFTDVIAAALESDLEPLPGVLTPTEARTAVRAGARLLKLFPATLGGPDYLKQIRAPLSDILFFPTGGITAQNAGDYMRAGATGIGAGSWLVPSDYDGSPSAEALLTERARQLMWATVL